MDITTNDTSKQLTFQETLDIVASKLDAKESEKVFSNVEETIEKLKSLQIEILKIYQDINKEIPDEENFVAYVKMINKRVDRKLITAKKSSLDEIRKLLQK